MSAVHYAMEGYPLIKPYSLPPWLNTVEKWNKVVEIVDSMGKFDALARIFLSYDEISLGDYYLLLKDMAHDIVEYHNDPTIVDLMYNLQDLIDSVSKFIEHRFQRIQEGEYDWCKKV